MVKLNLKILILQYRKHLSIQVRPGRVVEYQYTRKESSNVPKNNLKLIGKLPKFEKNIIYFIPKFKKIVILNTQFLALKYPEYCLQVIRICCIFKLYRIQRRVSSVWPWRQWLYYNQRAFSHNADSWFQSNGARIAGHGEWSRLWW